MGTTLKQNDNQHMAFQGSLLIFCLLLAFGCQKNESTPETNADTSPMKSYVEPQDMQRDVDRTETQPAQPTQSQVDMNQDINQDMNRRELPSEEEEQDSIQEQDTNETTTNALMNLSF